MGNCCESPVCTPKVLGTCPRKLSVKEWTSEHVIWWVANETKNTWFAEQLLRYGNLLNGKVLMSISELSLRDLGFTNPVDRLYLLSKIRELT